MMTTNYQHKHDTTFTTTQKKTEMMLLTGSEKLDDIPVLLDGINECD